MDTLFSKKTWDDLKITEDFSKVYDGSQLLSRVSAYALFYNVWYEAQNSARKRAKDLSLDFDSFPEWKQFILTDIVYNTGSVSKWTKVFTETEPRKVLFQARRKQTVIDSRVAKIGYHFGILEDFDGDNDIDVDDARFIGLSEAKYIV